MGGLFGGTHMQGLPEETRRGLISDAARRFGLELLAGAQDVNVGQTFANALGAGQDYAVQGAQYMRGLERQQQFDAQRTEQHEERMRRLREETRRRMEAEGDRAQTVATARQRLAEFGVDVSGLDDDAVLDTTADLIASQVEAQAAAAFPTPLTPAEEQYAELTRGQQDLTARELDLREAGKYAQAPARQPAPAAQPTPAQPAGTGASVPVGTPDPVMSKAIVDGLLANRPELAKAIQAARAERVPDAEILATLRERGLL